MVSAGHSCLLCWATQPGNWGFSTGTRHQPWAAAGAPHSPEPYEAPLPLLWPRTATSPPSRGLTSPTSSQVLCVMTHRSWGICKKRESPKRQHFPLPQTSSHLFGVRVSQRLPVCTGWRPHPTPAEVPGSIDFSSPCLHALSRGGGKRKRRGKLKTAESLPEKQTERKSSFL